MPVDLLLVYHPLGDGLLGNLPLIYLHFHSALKERHCLNALQTPKNYGTYICYKPIDVGRFGLAEPIHPVYALDVVRGIPGDVEDDYPIRGHQINS